MSRRGTTGLEDVARASGVSKMTVSRVLRGSGGFSDETRARVLREVDRLGYLPDRIAAAFGPGQASTLVGVCVPRLTSGLFGAVLESINATLTRLGHQTMIGSHEDIPEEEEAWLRGLASWRPAGVILSGRHHAPGTIRLLEQLTVPVVEIWDLNTSPIDVSVGFSHYDNGYEMGQFVAGRGRRQIGYVGALAERRTLGQTRLQGFVDGLEGAGLELVASEVLHDRPGYYAGYYGTETLLSRNPDLDLLYYHDDEMAIGGLAYCTAQGLRVPADIGIAGWGGMEAASILPLRLTTTVVPTTRIGKDAAEALIGRLRGDAVPDVMLVPTRLVPGGTV